MSPTPDVLLDGFISTFRTAKTLFWSVFIVYIFSSSTYSLLLGRIPSIIFGRDWDQYLLRGHENHHISALSCKKETTYDKAHFKDGTEFLELAIARMAFFAWFTMRCMDGYGRWIVLLSVELDILFNVGVLIIQ